MIAAFRCSTTTGDELQVSVTASGQAGPGGPAASRQQWLGSELRFLSRTCRHIPPANLAILLLRYTCAVVAEQPGYRGGTLVEVAGAMGAAGALACWEPSPDTFALEHKQFGDVVIVHELAGVGVYLLRIRPGGTIPWHVHRVMREAELVLGAGVMLQGRQVPRGTAIRWPLGHPHSYHNPTTAVQTVLCVDMPAFIPDDEIEVPAPELATFPAGVTVHRPDARSENVTPVTAR